MAGMTPLGDLIRSARLSAAPTQLELEARANRGGQQPESGISAAELADRINAGRAPHESTMARSSILRAEKRGPAESTLAAIVDALGLDVVLVPAGPSKR